MLIQPVLDLVWRVLGIPTILILSLLVVPLPGLLFFFGVAFGGTTVVLDLVDDIDPNEFFLLIVAATSSMCWLRSLLLDMSRAAAVS